MLKNLNKCSFLFLLIIIVAGKTDLRAQSDENTFLIPLLSTLEERYTIRFSYAPNELENIALKAPSNTLNLNEVLSFLTLTTPFIFTQINERYVTVVLKSQGIIFCGKILDAFTDEPIAGATVISIDNTLSAITNSEGYFFLSEANNTTQVRIRHLGYTSLNYILDDSETSCKEIFLKPSIDVLSPVAISTYFIKGISKQIDGSIVIDTDNFGLLPGQTEGDVLQIAQAIPGVESVDETISNINIRGGTHDENGIFWDDIKMYQSGHFFGLISAFNPDLTKKVTIYKNGTNPRFGEGVSGIIDMKSKNTTPDSISGGVGFNLINTHAFAEIPISKKLGLQLSGRRGITNFLKSPVYNIYTDRIFQDTEITNFENDQDGVDISSEEEFNFYDLSAKILYDPSEKDSFRLNFLTVDNVIEFTETLQSSSLSETSKLEQRSVVGGASWKRIWNPKFTTSALFYGSYYILDALNRDILTSQEEVQKNEVFETALKLDATLKLSEKNTLQIGYQFSETGIANTTEVNLPRFRIFEKDVVRPHVIFANLRYLTPNKTTGINAGFRGNYYSKFDQFLFEPRLSIHQKVGNGFAVEVLGEYKSQTTTQRIDFDSEFLGVEKRRWELANNEDVPIIKSKQVSLGFQYNKYNWFINLEGYYKFVEGITTNSQGFQNQFQFVRDIGNYEVKGLEFVLNKRTKSFSTWFSYSYMLNDYTFNNLTPTSFPNNVDISHTASLASSYFWKDIKLAVGINWHSGKPYTVPVQGDEITIQEGNVFVRYDLPNAERLPNYFRANLSAEYLWNLSQKFNAKINFAILNVLDTKNTINIRYAIDTNSQGENRVNRIEEFSLGITPNFSFQLLF